MELVLYHGSSQIVETPNVKFAKTNLDFGPGVYFTTYKKQATKWAKRKSIRKSTNAFLNIYQLLSVDTSYKVKNFNNENEQWLDYVVSCRIGDKVYLKYDIVIGPVADAECIE